MEPRQEVLPHMVTRQRALIVFMNEDDQRASPGGPTAATMYEVDLEADEAGVVCRLLRNQGKGQPHEADDATIRAWALRRKLPVSARGRVPAQIRRQYDQEHSDPSRPDTVADASSDQGDQENVVQLKRRQDGADT
ncbi:Lsr2 family DNA-binding protein [Amycolatopsis lurida]|uniref:Lsr2 family DNA-binding protein n=1 Tax=Amycolatopsis lurida TaxID=31959 RepID=UPI00364BE985